MQDYKIKIEVPNILEVVSEAFDGVLNLMTPNSVIFGGVLREIIAGFGSHEFLDIVVPQNEARILINSLRTSNKWTEEHIIEEYKQIAKIEKKEVVGVAVPHGAPGGVFLEEVANFSSPMSFSSKKYNGYRDYSSNIVAKTFVNLSDQKLQIITYKINELFMSDFEKVTSASVARETEFICDGLIMDVEGSLYEVIEGAKSDCLERVIRINPNGDIRANSLSNKINKMVQQGWTSEVDVNKVKQNIFRKKRNMDRKLARKNVTKTKKENSSGVAFTMRSVAFSKFQFDIHLPADPNNHSSGKGIKHLFYTITNSAHITLPSKLVVRCIYCHNELRLRMTLLKSDTWVIKEIKKAFLAYFAKNKNSVFIDEKQNSTSEAGFSNWYSSTYFSKKAIINEQSPLNKSRHLTYTFTGRPSTKKPSSESFKSYIPSFYAKSDEETDTQEHAVKLEQPLEIGSVAPPLKPIKKQSGLTKDEYVIAPKDKHLAVTARELKATLIAEGKYSNDRIIGNNNWVTENLNFGGQITEDVIVTKNRDSNGKEVILKPTKKKLLSTKDKNLSDRIADFRYPETKFEI
jgi:hypothetical protein